MESESDINDKYFSFLVTQPAESFSFEIQSLFERENNEWILSKVESSLRRYMQAAKELSMECVDESDLRELQITIETVGNNIMLFNEMKNKYEQNEKLSTILEQNPEIAKVVFARNKSGNLMIEKDLQEIRKYGDSKFAGVVDLIKKLQSGDTNFNSEKQKPLIGSSKTKGMYEMKDFQLRVIYMREGEFTVIVGALVKKDDNDLKFRDAIVNMRKQSEFYRQDLREGSLDVQEELSVSEKFIDSLIADKKGGK